MRTFYQLKIQARDIRPSIYRTIIIDSRDSFEDLHELIQDAFTLYNYHLWNFTVKRKNPLGNQKSEDSLIGPDTENSFDTPDFCADKTKLKDILTAEKQTALYWYDFGDDWKFNVQLQKIIPEAELDPEIDSGEIPLLLKTDGPDLLEDCGGNWGFAEILTVYVAIINGKTVPQALLDDAASRLGIESPQSSPKQIVAKVEKLYENAYPPGRPLSGQAALT